MGKPGPLLPSRARASLANRLGPRVDRLRQIATRLGVRPYQCFLVWTKYTGEERGEGNEVVAMRLELVPTPKVRSLDAITFNPFNAGTFPVGSVRLDLVSISYKEDLLRGKRLPEGFEEHIPQPWDFSYEIVEDGRGDNPAERKRFRLLGTPMRAAGRVCWQLYLERIAEDMQRDGTSSFGAGDG